jgi:hypothetical protein
VLANEFDTTLEFCLTHSPGRSRRFANLVDLQNELRSLAPAARVTATFPLRDSPIEDSHWATEQKILALLCSAEKLIERGDERNALGLIVRALEYDCGVNPDNTYSANRGLIRAYLPLILTNGRYPSTLAALSRIFYQWGDGESGVRLLKRYLETVSGMPPRQRLWLALRLKVQFRSRCRNIFTGLLVRSKK